MDTLFQSTVEFQERIAGKVKPNPLFYLAGMDCGKSGNILISGTLTYLVNEEDVLINQSKIDEWIREVEERPASAALIIQYIGNRLSELASREEELAAQNIELLST